MTQTEALALVAVLKARGVEATAVTVGGQWFAVVDDATETEPDPATGLTEEMRLRASAAWKNSAPPQFRNLLDTPPVPPV